MTGDAPSLGDIVRRVLEDEYVQALGAIEAETIDALVAELDEPVAGLATTITLGDAVSKIASIQHHGRGVLITLAACKAARPSQDICAHKDEHPGGFNARGIDTSDTVPFLRSRDLANAAESHWLTQVFSGVAFAPGHVLRTTPRVVGKILPSAVAQIQADGTDAARKALRIAMARLIEERNKSSVPLTKPKGLTIDAVISLLKRHFTMRYRTGAPRLPQLAFYAIYTCLVRTSGRFAGAILGELERLRTANRKSGSVGDVDVLRDSRPIEGVEIKFGMAVTTRHVSDAIEKIKAKDVKRYYIVATDGIADDDADEIRRLCNDFYRSNGCEIIVNGVYESIAYYLRMIDSTDDFVFTYVDLLAADTDLSYEHRLAWNTLLQAPPPAIDAATNGEG